MTSKSYIILAQEFLQPAKKYIFVVCEKNLVNGRRM